MSASDNLGRQFHEMTRDEFESQPKLWWHGTRSGIIGHQGSSFHVGSKEAAMTALAARIETHYPPSHDKQSLIKNHPTAQLYGGHITAPMTNTPHIDPSRGFSNKYEVREGIPRGEMTDWRRRSKTEVMSDVRANAVESGFKKRGVPMKRGIYYVNASEGAEEPEPISAIIPNRAGFKTHEDYLVEAREQGKKIPKRALKGYKEIPGQERLF